MLPFDNNTNHFASLLTHPSRSFQKSTFSLPSPSPHSVFNFYSPIQSILSFLNLTSFLHSSPTPNSLFVPTPHKNLITTSAVPSSLFIPSLNGTFYSKIFNTSFIPDPQMSIVAFHNTLSPETLLKKLPHRQKPLESSSTVFPGALDNSARENTSAIKDRIYSDRMGREVTNASLADGYFWNDSSVWRSYNSSESFEKVAELWWNASNATNTTLMEGEFTMIRVVTAVILALVILLTVVGEFFISVDLYLN